MNAYMYYLYVYVSMKAYIAVGAEMWSQRHRKRSEATPGPSAAS